MQNPSCKSTKLIREIGIELSKDKKTFVRAEREKYIVVELERYIELKREGLSDERVSNELGITIGQLARWKVKEDISRSTWYYEGYEEDIFKKQFKQYLKLSEQKLLQKEIQKEMGMTKAVFGSWKKKHNVNEKVAKLYEYYR